MDNVIWPKPGTYLLAVSGGVDSIVMLDLFAHSAEARKYQLYVAHFDHAMRPDSASDAAFVAELAQKYELRCFSGLAAKRLASEADARAARYDFLHRTAAKLGAKVITAHHQDDLIETSLLNLTRGSGRTGIAPFAGNSVLRPLRDASRADIQDYANVQNLKWHEDVSNLDLSNPRNLLRHRLLSQADHTWRSEYLAVIDSVSQDNAEIDDKLASLGDPTTDGVIFSRNLAMNLSQAELAELIASTIRQLDPSIELDRRILGEIVVFAKSGRAGQWRPIRGRFGMFVQRDDISIGNIVKNAPRRRNN